MNFYQYFLKYLWVLEPFFQSGDKFIKKKVMAKIYPSQKCKPPIISSFYFGWRIFCKTLWWNGGCFLRFELKKWKVIRKWSIRKSCGHSFDTIDLKFVHQQRSLLERKYTMYLSFQNNCKEGLIVLDLEEVSN